LSTLWSFGDSFSTPFSQDPYLSCKDYINFKGYTPKIFSEIVSESLGMDCVIEAKGGCDNYTIMENVCNIVDKVQDGDIIIIGWSNINRFRMVTKLNDWISILPFLRIDKSKEFNMDLLDIFAVNRITYESRYSDEVNSWIKLIDVAFKNCRVIHWSYFVDTKINAITFKNLTTIRQETKGVVDDGHYSEGGHRELANIFLKKILNKDTSLI